MFSHKTNSENILMYIDLLKKEDERYTVLGWIAHSKKRILSLQLDGKQITFTRQLRQDVKDAYPFLNNSDVGILLSLSKEDLYKNISLVLEDGTVEENIGTLEKWYIKSSGFMDSYAEVVVVDNFYEDPDAIRQFAINNLKFNPSGYHKGCRSERFILDGTKERFEKILTRNVTNWHHPGYANGVFQYCISGDPIVYHADQQTFAGIAFLTPNAPLNSGTSTFKSNKTGLLKFSKDQIGGAEFNATFTDNFGNLNFYDNSNLQLVDRVANIYNRLVLFEARSIHAAESYFGDNINNGRLFHIFFFDVE
jgi:hypothetical protein